MTGTNAMTLYMSAFVDELFAGGIRHAVVSPGSRSTPLALLLEEHPGIRVWIQIDERSAGFFALGLAKALREPVALLCTSGTAAANYFPAVAEGKLARVPLVVLTSDRPHELRHVGAPQTMDQLNLYGSHAKWFVDMPLPEEDLATVRYARSVARRAVGIAGESPRGPVHLNFPIREPLLPDLDHPLLYRYGREEERADASLPAEMRGTMMLPPAELDRISAVLASVREGIIVCGPQDDPELAPSLLRLAQLLEYPVLADPLSQLRCTGDGVHPLVIDTYDAFLRDRATAQALAPEVVIRFGAMPVSKPFMQYLDLHRGRYELLLVDEAAGELRDPNLAATTVLRADAKALCDQLAERLAALLPSAGSQDTGGMATSRHESGLSVDPDEAGMSVSQRVAGLSGGTIPAGMFAANLAEGSGKVAEFSGWAENWQAYNRIARDLLQTEADYRQDEFWFEGKVVKELADCMPDDSAIVLANSMPIRYADLFFTCSDKNIAFAGNRGVNGIDGTVSTAFGFCAAGKRTVLLTGDLSFFHDLNGLLAGKLYKLPLTIVLVNNDGGGIFSFLPQASLPRHFETLFGTPTGLEFEHAARLFGASYCQPADWNEFRAELRKQLSADGPGIIEVRTHRQQNVEWLRRIWPRLSDSLARYRTGGQDG